MCNLNNFLLSIHLCASLYISSVFSGFSVHGNLCNSDIYHITYVASADGGKKEKRKRNFFFTNVCLYYINTFLLFLTANSAVHS